MPKTLILRYLSYYNQCIIPQTGVQGNGNTLWRFTKCALGGRFSIPGKPGFKKFAEFSKKGLLFARRYDIIIKLIAAQTEYGRLAQLVEHLLDVQEVTGSSPVPSTIQFVLEPDSLRKRVRVRFLFTGGSAKGLLGTVNEQRQGITMTVVSCLFLCNQVIIVRT
jgi:hypothetical protein